MEVKDLALGQIFVTNNITVCGNYHMFWEVVEVSSRKALVARTSSSYEAINATETYCSPVPDMVSAFSLKVSKDAGGLYIGDTKDKKTLQKMYIKPYNPNVKYINVWDASKLKEK